MPGNDEGGDLVAQLLARECRATVRIACRKQHIEEIARRIGGRRIQSPRYDFVHQRNPAAAEQ
jgi:hypothetical protein